MRILLIKAASTRYYGQTVAPMGLLYLSAALKRAGHADVKLLHLDLEKPSEEELGRLIAGYGPDLIGISAITAESVSMHRVAALAKSLLPAVSVVAGGAHPTGYTDDCLGDPNIDAAVRNEGELTFLEIVEAAGKKSSFESIAGLSYRKGGTVVHNPEREFVADLDSLPMPDWEAADLGRYSGYIPHSPFLHTHKYANIVTSRGCPFNCTFCHNVMGKKFRAHSPERVIGELRHLKENLGITDIEVSDDVFNLDLARAKAIMHGIIDAVPGLNIFLSNGVRADVLDEELITLMRRAGVRFLCIAVETASPRLQRAIRKNVDLEKTRAVASLLVSNGIFVNGFFIFGLPGETLKELWLTMKYLWSLPIHTCMISFCMGYGGTELALTLPKEKLISPETDTVSFTSARPERACSDLPAWQLAAARQAANFVFYFLNPARLYRIFRDMPYREFRVLRLLLVKLITRTIFPR